MAWNSPISPSLEFLMPSLSNPFTIGGYSPGRPSPVAMANGHVISALCNHQPWLLPEVTGLEKLLLNQMRWGASLRQRKLMTAETLLNFISPACRTWHLKPRLARREHFFFDLPSPESLGSYLDGIRRFLPHLLHLMLSSHLTLPYYLLLKASALLGIRK